MHRDAAWIHEARADLRLADADRSAALRRLGKHRAAGRIDEVEYAERSDAVGTARTWADLNAIFADLERPAWAGHGSWTHRSRHRGFVPFPLFVLIVVFAVLAITGNVAWSALWIVLGIAGLLLLLAPRRRRWAC